MQVLHWQNCKEISYFTPPHNANSVIQKRE
jgi:hypothetical protein